MEVDLGKGSDMTYFWDQLFDPSLIVQETNTTFVQETNATTLIPVANDSWICQNASWTYANSSVIQNGTSENTVALLHVVGKAIILGLVILSTVIGEFLYFL